jgi:hypothetical protein
MIFKIFTPLVFSSLLFAACCNCGITKDGVDIPEKLKAKSDEFVISKTGREFFEQYIKINIDRTTRINNGYMMVYNFSIPDKDGVEGEIRFSVDSLGNVLKDKEIVGIPGCISNSENCDFKITKDDAASIAEQKGFDKGIKDWDVNFIWDIETEKYLWQFRTTLNESKGTEYNRSSGRVMLIDPNNGDVIKTEDWRVN